MNLRDLEDHPAHTTAGTKDQQRLVGFDLDLVDQVLGSGAGDREGGCVGEGDLLGLHHRLLGVQDGVLLE